MAFKQLKRTKQLFIVSPYDGRQVQIDGNLSMEPRGFIPSTSVLTKWMFPYWIREAHGRSPDSPGFPAVAAAKTLGPEMLALPSVQRYFTLAQESTELWLAKRNTNTFLPWALGKDRRDALLAQGVTTVRLLRWEACYASKFLAFFYDLEHGLIFCKDRLVKVPQ